MWVVFDVHIKKVGDDKTNKVCAYRVIIEISLDIIPVWLVLEHSKANQALFIEVAVATCPEAGNCLRTWNSLNAGLPIKMVRYKFR